MFFQVTIQVKVKANRRVTLSQVGSLSFYRHEKIGSVKRQTIPKIFGSPVRLGRVVMIHEQRVLDDEEALYDTTVRNDSVVVFHLNN